MDEKKVNDKKAALEAAMASIEKQYGQGSVMKLGDNKHMSVDVISTGGFVGHFNFLLKVSCISQFFFLSMDMYNFCGIYQIIQVSDLQKEVWR